MPRRRKIRTVLASLNLLTTLVLLGVLFIMVNYLATRRYARWDLSRIKLTALSDQTAQTLRSLTDPMEVIVFYQPDHRLYELVKDLLQEYARVNPAIRVEYVDPEQDVARAKHLAKTYEIADPNVVIFTMKERHQYLSDTELADYDYSAMAFGAQPRVKAFKGEAAFTAAIISLTHATPPRVWFTTGHGEKSLDDAEPTGLSDLKKALDQQNIAGEAVTLLERPEIPAEVKLIVIAGPTRRLTESELLLLEAFLQRGGRLLAMIDPLDDTGLDGLLARWGMALGMDIVVDPARQLPFVSAANLFVTTYTDHPIVKKMKTFMTLFPLARSVRADEARDAAVTVTPLALTSERGWGETKTAEQPFRFEEGRDAAGPVSIAVAAERALPSSLGEAQAGAEPSRTRLVVIGDSDFVVNSQLGSVGNRDLVLGAVYWLIEEERLIGIGPKTLESLRLHLTGGQLSGIFWLSFVGLPLACGLLGVGMWLLRRK